MVLVLALAPALVRGSQIESRRFCVLVPHFKDEYWLSVGYGLEQEARRHGITLLFHEAGGYRARTAQIAQLDACAASRVDAILIGAVTSDHPDLIETLTRVAQRVPVFGLVNELHSDALSGRIGVDWRDMGRELGAHLARLHPEGSRSLRAVLISGPPEAGWVAPLEQGLRAGLAASSIEIVAVYGADTGLRQQLDQVERALEAHPEADLLIGSAPAVEAAIGHFTRMDRDDEPQLAATYLTHTIKRGLLNGRILAAPFDDPVKQGAMAVRQALAVLAGGKKAGLDGPAIRVLRAGDAAVGEVRLSPSDYFPELP